MRAKELVPILAEIYGVPFEAAFMIDRSLSECGLRVKGKGRSLPDMTRPEALTFMLACMATQKITQAGQEVLPWLSATGIAPWQPEPAPDLTPGEDDETLTHRIKLFNMIDPLLAPFKSDHQKNPTLGLMNYLLALCSLLQNGRIEAGCVKLEICTSHPAAEISHSTLSGNTIFQTDYFMPELTEPCIYSDATHQIRRSVSVYGDALLAIAARTADPLSGGA